MVGIQDWFNVYAGIRDAVNGLRADLDATKNALQSIKNSITSDQGSHLDRLADSIETIRTTITKLETDLKGITTALGPELPLDVRTVIDQLSLLNQTHAIIRNQLVPVDQGGPRGNIAETLKAVTTAAADPNSPTNQAMTQLALFFGVMNMEGSLSGAENLSAFLSDLRERFPDFEKTIREAQGKTPAQAVKQLKDDLTKIGTDLYTPAVNAARSVLTVMEKPFQQIVGLAIQQFQKDIEAGGEADITTVKQTAINALTKAFEIGQAAHLLAIAGEMAWIGDYMGIPQAAAAITDFSGFRDISASVARATIGAAITRPMRWAGNISFRPEILPVRDLVELVQKRVINKNDFAQVLYLHGFKRDDADLLVRAVDREPTIRDLALAIEDTTVPDDWLRERVQKAGYSDDDADQLTNSLKQRALKAARGRVITAALANVTDGLLDTESYRTILERLQLRPEEIEFQIQTADLTARRDTVNTAIATYKRSYVNGQIERSDFTLALTALGVNPDRVDLIALDADAQRQPRIAREEEQKVKEAVREIQTELVPRYRRLYELGVISEDSYQNILIEAGVSPQVAAQAVLLDRQKRQIVIQTATATALERETARLIADTEEALRLQFRKGLIDEAQLKNSLLDLGYSDERVGVIVNQERARLAPPPGKTIEAPAEAKARVIRDLAIQTALNDFRQDRIDVLDLYDAMVAQGISEDEALARVNLEISRLPAPTTG